MLQKCFAQTDGTVRRKHLFDYQRCHRWLLSRGMTHSYRTLLESVPGHTATNGLHNHSRKTYRGCNHHHCRRHRQQKTSAIGQDCKRQGFIGNAAGEAKNVPHSPSRRHTHTHTLSATLLVCLILQGGVVRGKKHGPFTSRRESSAFHNT